MLSAENRLILYVFFPSGKMKERKNIKKGTSLDDCNCNCNASGTRDHPNLLYFILSTDQTHDHRASIYRPFCGSRTSCHYSTRATIWNSSCYNSQVELVNNLCFNSSEVRNWAPFFFNPSHAVFSSAILLIPSVTTQVLYP